MKQLIQSLGDGETRLDDVPAPRAAAGQLLIRTTTSLVSAGTERMMVEFGKANLLQKAAQQPEQVKRTLEKARTDGIAATVDAVRSRLDQPMLLGYCNVGRVVEAGGGVAGYTAGDRVASNGKHAEIVAVPKNLCARIPESVSDEAAAFTVLGAIGLQGIRLTAPTLGECVAVIGLGLIGLLTVQMLRAQGCRVLGIDLNPTRLAMAEKFGAEVVNPGAGEDVLARAAGFSRGAGMDAVIITAATKSNDPVTQAARMSRQRGRIVLVGVVGLELNRSDFYEKELSFQVSCSYGPGRYDPGYEEGGHDYPIGFVRWTEQRNFEAVLDLMASGALDVEPLITHRFAFSEAAQAMGLLVTDEPSLGILMAYDQAQPEETLVRRHVPLSVGTPAAAKGNVAFIGAGNYAGRVLIPAFKATGANLRTLVSGGGVSSSHLGRKFGFAAAATDSDPVFADASIDTVVIATRHNAHAAQVLDALRAGKHVFCEKPLCLSIEELDAIETESASRPDQHVMVGFNRRFAPQTVKMKSLLAPIEEPKSFIVTVNSGAVPPDHWVQDPAVGGGRLVGEACHFIDLLRHLAGSEIVSHRTDTIGRHPSIAVRDDKAVITLHFADGSIGTIHYLANGEKSYPKERIEVFCAGRILQLDNFLRLKGWGWPSFSKLNLWQQDKGQTACAAAFMDAVRKGTAAPIPKAEIFEVSRVAIEAAKVED